MKSRRHPGTVRSDVQAFRQISRRFQDEVGRIIGRVDFVHGPVPFWSLVRMMFPVAESLGDLIYRRDNATAQNLRAVLENDFEAVRTGYRGKAALLALLYRHSLTHHDELRVLSSGGKKVGWKVSGDEDSSHITAVHTRANAVVIEFTAPKLLHRHPQRLCESEEKALEWTRTDSLQRVDAHESRWCTIQQHRFCSSGRDCRALTAGVPADARPTLPRIGDPPSCGPSKRVDQTQPCANPVPTGEI